MAVYHLPTTRNSEVLIQLVKEHGVSLEACVEVAMNNDNLDTATFECKMCCESYLPNQVSIGTIIKFLIWLVN